VNLIGNKTRELEITSKAAAQLHTQAVAAQQSVSGVNLDEEAANLLRYQQAYQASGKVMKTASDLFDLLLTIGR
jgi:flagellar hook-associated protein 1 FlgK